PSGPKLVSRRRGAWIWYSAAALVVVGGADAFFVASGDDGPKPSRDPVTVKADAATSVGHDAAVTTEPAASPLALFAGHWRSTSGRDFMAVPVGDDALEFRIVQASQHARQGYEDGEVRFKLVAVPGAKDEFTVEDHLRPTPLPGFEYDPKASRES